MWYKKWKKVRMFWCWLVVKNIQKRKKRKESTWTVTTLCCSVLLLDKQASYVPEISNFRWTHSSAHTEYSVTFSTRSIPGKDSEWIFFIILQTTCLEDFFLRMISFGQEDSSDWNFSIYGFPISGARSRSSSNPAFYTVFSPLLDFSGSIGFGTWRIFVPLFWATSRLFSRFLLFWILEHFCLWILYTLFTLVLLRHQRGLFYYCGSSHTLFYPLSLWDKKGEYLLSLDRECIFNRSSDFCPRMAKWGVC
jgi:hypothetical protein